MGALIMIIHSDHFIVHFRECGLGMCWALCQIPYKKQSTEKRVDKKKTTNYPFELMHIRHLLFKQTKTRT